MRYILIVFGLLSFAGFCACDKKSGNPNINPPDTITTNPPDTGVAGFFAKGADVSWITEMEAQGRIFKNRNNQEQECMAILKGMGMNAIRLRVWVNPANGYNNIADVLAKASRARTLGMKIMIDFHYSDTWADPGHQVKPAAWNSAAFPVLLDSVYNHTRAVLNALKLQGINPTWVQVGNETNDGLLWEDGRASSNMPNYAQIISKGYDAVKSVDTTIKVIVHLSNGWDNGLYRWNMDGLKNNGAKWDVIGMSLYPSAATWQNLNLQCLSNMNDMVARYNSDVMVTEVGMSWTDSIACKEFISDLINKTKQVTNHRGRGVMYWEPESYNNWNGYTLGAFDNSGKPTIALTAFN